MSFDDSASTDRTVLQLLGKYLAFFSAAVFCWMFTCFCIVWMGGPQTDRQRGQILYYYGMLTIASSCMLLAGLALRFQRSLVGFGLMFLALIVFVCGLPDR